MNTLVNDLIFIQVVQAAFVFANSLILLIAVRKMQFFAPKIFSFHPDTNGLSYFQYDLTVAEFNMTIFWLSAFLAEMAIYCYFGNNIIYTVISFEFTKYLNLKKKYL